MTLETTADGALSTLKRLTALIEKYQVPAARPAKIWLDTRPTATVLASAAALWRNYHDTGEMSAEPQGSRRWILRLDRFTASSREFCRLLSGYFRELAELTGATQVDVSKMDCCLDGAAGCVREVTGPRSAQPSSAMSMV